MTGSGADAVPAGDTAGGAAGDTAGEIVAVYDPADDAGRAVGSAPRERMRRENLPHAASVVLVRRLDGRVFVHRRAATKDLWPGLHDATAGGVVLAGEAPDDGARRELAEELGIDGAGLVPVLRRWYRDEHTWFLGFVYLATWDGEVRFTDGEVADGWWEDPHRLYERLADPAVAFVPDTRGLLEMPEIRSLLLAGTGLRP